MPYSLSSPRLWIAEGLLNKNAWVWDFIVSQTDMIWVVVKNLFVLYSSVWNFDRGKLVILNVFIKFHYFETAKNCHIQVTKVVRKTRNEPGKIITFLVIVSSFKPIFHVSHCYASAANMCISLHISFEEREEDLIPMGMVTLNSVRIPLVHVSVWKILVGSWLKKQTWLGIRIYPFFYLFNNHIAFSLEYCMLSNNSVISEAWHDQ